MGSVVRGFFRALLIWMERVANIGRGFDRNEDNVIFLLEIVQVEFPDSDYGLLELLIEQVGWDPVNWMVEGTWI